MELHVNLKNYGHMIIHVHVFGLLTTCIWYLTHMWYEKNPTCPLYVFWITCKLITSRLNIEEITTTLTF